MVATKASVFNVYEYTKVIDTPIVGWQRYHIERWYDTKGRLLGRKVDEYRGMGQDANDEYCNRGPDVRWQDNAS